MAARFVISGWDTLEDTQRSNIKAMLKSVIGVNSEVDLDIRNESGDADDVRKISYAPTILAAISQEYLNCLTAGRPRSECEALYGTRALFSRDHASLI